MFRKSSGVTPDFFTFIVNSFSKLKLHCLICKCTTFAKIGFLRSSSKQILSFYNYHIGMMLDFSFLTNINLCLKQADGNNRFSDKCIRSTCIWSNLCCWNCTYFTFVKRGFLPSSSKHILSFYNYHTGIMHDFSFLTNIILCLKQADWNNWFSDKCIRSTCIWSKLCCWKCT